MYKTNFVQPQKRYETNDIKNLLFIVSSPQIVEDWKFVSMVLDRFFLWLFTLSCVFGTLAIICQSPSLYDTRSPIDRQLSEIPLRKNNFMLPPDIVRQVLT